MMTEDKTPKITFGIIVLNGEPFTRYCLRSIYPYAHQIIVVEGGSSNAASQCTPDGHSTDGTLEVLRQFKQEEDPDNKLEIVTREGFWEEKDQQSRAYAERATGDWLWQIDIDEFYTPEAMENMLWLLQDQPDITAGSFVPLTFWGGLDYVCEAYVLDAGAYHRFFKWGPGYEYFRHRPPTVVDENGTDLREKKWMDGKDLQKHGIEMYHYCMLFPHQVLQKASYYKSLFGGKVECVDNARQCYMELKKPFHVYRDHIYISWLKKFTKKHPPHAVQMIEDIKSGKIKCELRLTDDIESLLSSPWYNAGRFFLSGLSPLVSGLIRFWWGRPWWLRRELFKRLFSAF